MYWMAWRWSSVQWLGAWVAAAVCGVIAEIGFGLNAPLMTVAGLSGLPLGVLVAGRFAPEALAARSAVVIGLRIGLHAGIVTLLALFLGLAVGTLVLRTDVSFADRVVQVGLAAVGVPVYGAVFGLPFALLGGVVGALALRTVRARGRVGTRGLVVASAGLSAIALVDVLSWL